MKARAWWALGAVALTVATNSCGLDARSDKLSDTSSEVRGRSWPQDPVRDYSSTFGIGTVKSAGVDDAYNIWLLDYDNRIGVLRPGDSAPRWFSNVGQAGRGFTSFTLCGGSANHAYVGYLAVDLDNPGAATPEQKQQGDADLVRLDEGGDVVLEQHLTIVNSNDPRYDETRSVLSCAKVMRGANRGDVYFGTNHAVTRVRGAQFSDHRHALWADAKGAQHIGYNFAVSITQDGDVFLGNEWKIGLVTPSPKLEEWTNPSASPWRLDTFVEAAGSEEDQDFWRATAQTADRRYYVGSLKKGLWEVSLSPRRYTELPVPSNSINALAATDDGSLFIGTGNQGLWWMKPDKTLERVTEVPGERVTQLVYDPTLRPSMLYVVSDGQLFVLRGH